MSKYYINSGKYVGKRIERVVFQDLSYCRFLIEKGYHEHLDYFSVPERNRFMELVRRAEHLGGKCSRCDNDVTQMVFTRDDWQRLLHIDLFCADCQDFGRNERTACRPSLHPRAMNWPPKELKKVRYTVARYYIGVYLPNQAELEEFFRNDANFVNATPGYFTKR